MEFDKKSIEHEVDKTPMPTFIKHLALEKNDGTTPTSETIVNAMNEFAMKKSTAFVEWASKGFVRDSVGWRRWLFNDWVAENKMYRTTVELYDLFLKE